MNIDMEQNRLLSLRQDFTVLRDTLGVVGMRRVMGDLVDIAVAGSLALVLHRFQINPWFVLAYFFASSAKTVGGNGI